MQLESCFYHKGEKTKGGRPLFLSQSFMFQGKGARALVYSGPPADVADIVADAAHKNKKVTRLCCWYLNSQSFVALEQESQSP